MARQTPQTNTDQNPEFGIQRIYVKDLSLESPLSPSVFLEKNQPEVNMDLATNVNQLGENNHEVILTVTVTIKMNDKTAFVIEVKQAGIFTLTNFPQDQMRPLLGSYCPNILFPYAREVVTDAAVRAGFPQLYLAPVNFDALYEQFEQTQPKEEDVH